MKEILHFKLPGKIQPFELISISKWIRPENSAGCTKRRDFLYFLHTPTVLDVLSIKQGRQTVIFTYSRDIAKFVEQPLSKVFLSVIFLFQIYFEFSFLFIFP